MTDKISIGDEDLVFIRELWNSDVQTEEWARNVRLLSKYKCLVNMLRGVRYAHNFENVKAFLEGQLDGLKKFILERMDNEIEMGSEIKSDLEMSINRYILNKYEDIIKILNEVNDKNHIKLLKIELLRTNDHILARLGGSFK